MNTITALKEYDLRIKAENGKWLAWDNIRQRWFVFGWLSKKQVSSMRMNEILYEGKSFRKALDVLVKE